MLSKYLDHFPQEYSPSSQQVKLIKSIEKAFGEGKKFIICSAPTGSGKSFLAKTLAGVSQLPSENIKTLINSYQAYKQDYVGNYQHEVECLSEAPFGAFALTITKSLQDQYLKLFPDTDILKGRTNYRCNVDERFDVETAPCVFLPKLKDDCWEKNFCTYYNQRNKSLLSQFSVLNYKMFLSLPSHIKRKNFIICDEASELEEELVRRFSAEIVYDKLKMYGIEVKPIISENRERAFSWTNDVILALSEKINTLTSKAAKKEGALSQPERITLLYLKNIHRSLLTVNQNWKESEYIVDYDAKKISFLPLRINKLSKHIFDYADNILLMSATIIDHKNFAKNLGIENYSYVEVDSEFDPQKSPIYVTSKNRLNYKNIKNILPVICDHIKSIADHHIGEKGIIHTHSNEITEILKSKLRSDSRYLFRDDTTKNEEILKEHFESRLPTILVSPSLAYGIDLKDDYARFQIIVKLPFSPLSSKRIKKLFEMDRDWYENKMLNSLVQACGRATRSKQDFSTTYILDGNIYNTLKNVKTKLPKYFIDRIC